MNKNNTEKINRMKELVQTLEEANKAYYKEDREIMTNFTYDSLYDELVKLESETSTVLSNSPTNKVGYEVSESLEKEQHSSPMLSLDKTKDKEELLSWLGDKEGVLSWKLDGLTIILTYEDGKLSKAVTRGNGSIGEVVTANAKTFQNIPLNISFKGRLVVRGEAYISYEDFEKINLEIEDVEAKYKNPRNLVSGSVRQLNSEITSRRRVNFNAFFLSEIEGEAKDSNETGLSFYKQLKWLENQGFEVVENYLVDRTNLVENIDKFSKKIESFHIPCDGLVLSYDDIEYGKSLGATSKFPRNAIAFKWQDEIKETTLREIRWSPSRTGLINPIAIFDPVDLEGTIVSRASVHNVSILKELQLAEGDIIRVYKANMIIPQIEENLTRGGEVVIPSQCPACNSQLTLRRDDKVEVLVCTNETCPAKKIKGLSHFVSRDAMNIENLSEATLEKFVNNGIVRDFISIFNLEEHKNEILSLEGFGEKSYNKLISSIDKSRKTNLYRLLYGLGIEGIGVANSKVIARYFNFDLDKIKRATEDEMQEIEGVGQVLAKTFVKYFENEENILQLEALERELEFVDENTPKEDSLLGMTFVITGSLEQFENRNQLKDLIESKGGKVVGSVSKNTNFLINNNRESSSSKNKKAIELGIEIIDEERIFNMIRG